MTAKRGHRGKQLIHRSYEKDNGLKRKKKKDEKPTDSAFAVGRVNDQSQISAKAAGGKTGSVKRAETIEGNMRRD